MKQAYFLSHIGKNNQFCCIALTKYLPYKHNLFFIFHYIFHNYKNSSSLLIKSFQIKNRIPQKAKCDLCKLWSGQRGSNSLPPPWQGGALPDELCPHFGASGRNRTIDTRIFSPLLYRLSYRGK